MRSKNSPKARHKTGTTHQTPAPKGRKKTAQDEVLGTPQKKRFRPRREQDSPRPEFQVGTAMDSTDPLDKSNACSTLKRTFPRSPARIQPIT